MVANWFTGSAPWGVDLRRNPIGLRLYQRHALLTGLSNHGKTAALRARRCGRCWIRAWSSG